MINICVPTLRRYDRLREMILSCLSSNIRPDNYYIIDNGRNTPKLLDALKDIDIGIKLHTPERPMGIARCWNWFIDRVPEERVIVNDDIIFQPTSLEQMVASKADLVHSKGVGFSCFILRDRCVEKLGRFDETISPDYGYYEDEDYLQRLDGRGTREPSAILEDGDFGVVHFKSSTLQVASHEETLEHHRLFKMAQANYARKWGLEAAFR